MYETMINSLKCHDSASSMLVSQIQASERQTQDKVIEELKDQKRRMLEEIESKDREFKRILNDKDSYMKELQIQIERLMLEKSQQMFTWETEKKDLQQKLQTLQSEKDRIEVKLELKNQSKFGELQIESEKMKMEH